MSDEYNGYKNYETWNVALWIQNDEGLHGMARRARDCKRFVSSLEGLGAIETQTPDNVSWTDPDLDIEALDQLLEDL